MFLSEYKSRATCKHGFVFGIEFQISRSTGYVTKDSDRVTTHEPERRSMNVRAHVIYTKKHREGHCFQARNIVKTNKNVTVGFSV